MTTSFERWVSRGRSFAYVPDVVGIGPLVVLPDEARWSDNILHRWSTTDEPHYWAGSGAVTGRIQDLSSSLQYSDNPTLTDVVFGVDMIASNLSKKVTLAELQKLVNVRVANIAALSALAASDNDVVTTRGYTTAGVGAGTYRFVAGDSTTVDGGFVITGNGGRWHLVDKTIANVRQFGAVGDNAATDTVAIQSAVSTGVPVYVPAGTYLIDDAIEFGANFVMYGDGPGRSEIKWKASASSQIMFKNNATVDTLYVRDLRFRHRADSSASFTDGGAILTNSGKSILIDNCDFIDMSTTCLELMGTDDAVTRQDCTVQNCRAWNETASYYSANFCKPGSGRTVIFRGNRISQYSRAISLEMKNNRSIKEVIITDNVIDDSKVGNVSTTQTAAPIHLSLETGTQTIESVVISDNIIRNTNGIDGTTSAGYGIALTCSANTIKRAIISDNIIDTWSGRTSSSLPISVKGVEYPIITGNQVTNVTWSSTNYRGMVVQTYTYAIVSLNNFQGTTYSAPIVAVGSLNAIEMRQNFCNGFEIQHNQAPNTTWATVPPGVANPDISGLTRGKLTDTGANTVTSLNNGVDTQELTLWIANNNTTLQNNANIKLAGSTNYNPGANGAILVLYCDNGVWREISRTAF